MASKKSVWEDIFGKESSVFVTERVDPESLDGIERMHMLDSIFKDYTFYLDQKADSYIIQLYEDTLLHLIKIYGH